MPAVGVSSKLGFKFEACSLLQWGRIRMTLRPSFLFLAWVCLFCKVGRLFL